MGEGGQGSEMGGGRAGGKGLRIIRALYEPFVMVKYMF